MARLFAVVGSPFACQVLTEAKLLEGCPNRVWEWGRVVRLCNFANTAVCVLRLKISGAFLDASKNKIFLKISLTLSVNYYYSKIFLCILMLARHYLKFGKVPLYSNWIAIP
jgi:hypothetical protein